MRLSIFMSLKTIKQVVFKIRPITCFILHLVRKSEKFLVFKFKIAFLLVK